MSLNDDIVSLFTLAPMRVALVEDDPLLRKEIHYHLKQQGFLVFAVNSGRSLDDLLITEPIDALVLDLTLPGEDGISIARRMRSSILTNSEKALLVGLAQASHHVLETEVICELLSQRPDADDIGKRALESLVSRLRKKLSSLSPEGAEPTLKAVWGVGYQLCIPIEIRP
jgi:DNA-binding response OmpR family regulator